MLSGRDRKYLETLLSLPRLSVMALRPTGEIDFWSAGAQELFGYTSSEAEGRSIFDLIVPPDRLPEARVALGDALSVGHASFETLRRKNDGTLVSVEVTMKFVPGGEGGEPFVLTTQRDITRRKQTEERLRASEEQYRRIVETAAEGIWTIDINGATSYINRRGSTILGYDVQELIGRNPGEFTFPGDDSFGRQFGMPNQHEAREGDHRLRRKDGSEVFVHTVTAPILGERGEYRGALAMFTDISERKRLREELGAIARRRSEDLLRFAFSVQHAQEEERQRIARELHDDLGQRLTGMKLKIEILEEDLPADGADFRTGLGQVKKGIEGMVGEIRRISSNLRPPVLDDFGLVAAVRLLCKEFEGSRKVTVRFRGDTVRCGNKDAEIALYRIAQEALSNVARHAKAKTVAVRLSQHGDRLRLVVEDDGMGVDLTRRNGDGRRKGLGLIGMNERAQLLGGSLKVMSSPGCGMRVEAELPADAGEGEGWRKQGS